MVVVHVEDKGSDDLELEFQAIVSREALWLGARHGSSPRQCVILTSETLLQP